MNTRCSGRPLSHRQQRGVYALLSLAALLVPLPLLIQPPQPPLPRLSAPLQPVDGWRVTAAPVNGPARADTFHPFGRAARLGSTLALVRGSGSWLLLTPLASWSHRGLDPALVTGGIPALSLRNPTVRRRPGSLDEVASTASRPALHQACLNRAGQLGHDPETLKAQNPHPSASLPRILRQVIQPGSLPPVGFSCLLITTNAADVLDGSERAQALLRRLASSVQWPASP